MKKVYEVNVTTANTAEGIEGIYFYRLFEIKEDAVNAFALFKSFYTSDLIKIELIEADISENDVLFNQSTIDEFRMQNEDGETPQRIF
ncbi:MAG: hypothetical protein COA44_13160 [Arcobacter sp.]|nr:MAG: hypothetical protein COA44_13160 [Arcobacter sp.]